MIQRYRINLKTIQEERSAMRALASAEKRTTPDSQ
jgi:hypothetical protein